MDRRPLIACAALLVACAGVPRARMIAEVETPAQVASLATPIDFELATQATAYNQPAASSPTSPDADAIFAAFVDQAGEHGQPVRDARLDLVADQLAAVIARGGEPDAELVDFALHGQGVVEPVHALFVANARTSAGAISELVPELADSLHAGNVHVGIGGGGERPFVAVIIHTALVTLPPTVPRALGPRGSFTFAATVDTLVHAPHLTVTYADDREARAHPPVTKLDAITFQATIACGEHVGSAWLLVEASDVKNVAQRLALVPIACAVPLPTRYRLEPRANTRVGDGELAHRLAAIVNRERAAAHLPPLAGDLRADRAAHLETALMLRADSVEHGLGGTTTTGRLRDEGLIPLYTLEATLHARDLAAAAEILMNTPGYRELLVNPDATHLGISIGLDAQHQLFVALELVAIVPPIDAPRIERDVFERIAARAIVREPRLREDLHRDKFLDKLARDYVLNRARGWTDKTVTYALQHDPSATFGPYGITWRALTLLLTDDVAKVDLGDDKPFTGVGVAAIQAPRNGALAGRTYVIVLYGKSR